MENIILTEAQAFLGDGCNIICSMTCRGKKGVRNL